MNDQMTMNSDNTETVNNYPPIDDAPYNRALEEILSLQSSLEAERQRVKELEKQVDLGKSMYSQLLQNSFAQISTERDRADKAEEWKKLARGWQKEFEHSQACCADLRETIKVVYDYSLRNALLLNISKLCENKLSSPCGQGWVSPEEVKGLWDLIETFRSGNGMSNCTEAHLKNMSISSSDVGRPARAEIKYRAFKQSQVK